MCLETQRVGCGDINRIIVNKQNFGRIRGSHSSQCELEDFGIRFRHFLNTRYNNVPQDFDNWKSVESLVGDLRRDVRQSEQGDTFLFQFCKQLRDAGHVALEHIEPA